MTAEELNEKFDKWNPMASDYENKNFNRYLRGPGAALEDGFLPGKQPSENSNETTINKPIPTLVFKKVPKGMTIKALKNICSKHGQVTAVRNSRKTPYFFVELATVADMEAVFRALENSDYGFKVVVNKISKEPTDLDLFEEKQNVPVVPQQDMGVDYQNRSYQTSSKQHPRPKFQEDPLIDEETCELLKISTEDSHSLERQGLYKMPNSDKFYYRNGRAYIFMPENTKKFIDKKHAESQGAYEESLDKYYYMLGDVPKPSRISKCSQCSRDCDIVCGRCSIYYCSAECQLKDWPKHRYICGKPKHLQEKHSVNNATDSTISNLTLSNEPIGNNSNNEENLSRVCEENDVKNDKINTTHHESNTTSSSSSLHEKTQVSPEVDEEALFPNMPRSGSIVTITSISTINKVFIRSKSYDDNLNFFKIVDTLQSIGKKLKPLTTPPHCRSIVIAKFENQFYRAIVLNANDPNEIKVDFMDYGNIDLIKMENLYEAPIEFVSKPRYAIPVVLKNVSNHYMTEEIRTFMYTYLHNIDVEIRYEMDFYEKYGFFVVELIDETTQQNLNKVIAKLAKPVEPQNMEEICLRDYLEHKPLPSGKNVELVVMDNSLMVSGCISCSTIPYAIEIQKFQKDFEDYVRSVPKGPYTPRVGELCIARYSEDGLWYRGECLETVGDGYPSILFVDYGNISPVSIDDIRRYPRQFTFPIYTADCEIKGLPESCDEKLVAKLEELILSGKVICCANVTAYEADNFYSIEMPSVINELKKCDLI